MAKEPTKSVAPVVEPEVVAEPTAPVVEPVAAAVEPEVVADSEVVTKPTAPEPAAPVVAPKADTVTAPPAPVVGEPVVTGPVVDASLAVFLAAHKAVASDVQELPFGFKAKVAHAGRVLSVEVSSDLSHAFFTPVAGMIKVPNVTVLISELAAKFHEHDSAE